MKLKKIERYNQMVGAITVGELRQVNPNEHPLPLVNRRGKPQNQREQTACDLYDAIVLEGGPKPGSRITNSYDS